MQIFAQGYQIEAVDAACTDKSCVVLSTVVGKVATGGATLFFGAPYTPSSSWKRIDVMEKDVEHRAVPIRIVSLDKLAVVVAFQSDNHFIFVHVKDQSKHVVESMTWAALLLDVVSTSQQIVATTSLVEPGLEACSIGQNRIQIAPLGRTPVVFSAPVVPLSAYARPIRNGTFVS